MELEKRKPGRPPIHGERMRIFSFSAAPEMLDRLKATAKRLRCSQNYIIREAIETFLESEEEIAEEVGKDRATVNRRVMQLRKSAEMHNPQPLKSESESEAVEEAEPEEIETRESLAELKRRRDLENFFNVSSTTTPEKKEKIE